MTTYFVTKKEKSISKQTTTAEKTWDDNHSEVLKGYESKKKFGKSFIRAGKKSIRRKKSIPRLQYARLLTEKNTNGKLGSSSR